MVEAAESSGAMVYTCLGEVIQQITAKFIATVIRVLEL